MYASDLKKGDTAKIKQVEFGELQNKLIEMGCFEGNSIRMLYVAPLGDPIAFDINGYILGLRKEEAKLIEVSLL
ncbi:MAG: ferrous iron transport protein A [Bacteroidetes bacterium]|nr:ferrous iron transport protein A [Bacteroidota bacterium]